MGTALPTLAVAASKLGRRGNQGALDAIVATGIAPKDAPTFCGKRGCQGNIDAVVATGIAPEDAPSYTAKRACDSRRIRTIICATENSKNTVQHLDGHCNPCHKLVPRKLKAEFCIGVRGRVCGGGIERVNQCYKCYSIPEEKKMREANKAALPKCSIYGCGGNELRAYGLCRKHYRKNVKDAKAKIKVATDGNF